MAKSLERRGKAEVIAERLQMTVDNIINERSPDYRSIYANNAAFTMSAFDFSAIFGEILGIADDKIHVEQKIKVTMSPQHAKLFAQVLMQNVETFEKTFGTIPLPPQSELMAKKS
jgi:hypothetical protein